MIFFKREPDWKQSNQDCKETDFASTSFTPKISTRGSVTKLPESSLPPPTDHISKGVRQAWSQALGYGRSQQHVNPC